MPVKKAKVIPKAKKRPKIMKGGLPLKPRYKVYGPRSEYPIKKTIRGKPGTIVAKKKPKRKKRNSKTRTRGK